MNIASGLLNLWIWARVLVRVSCGVMALAGILAVSIFRWRSLMRCLKAFLAIWLLSIRAILRFFIFSLRDFSGS